MLFYIQLYLSALLGAAGILALVFAFFAANIALNEAKPDTPRFVAGAFMVAGIIWTLVSVIQVFLVWSY